MSLAQLKMAGDQGTNEANFVVYVLDVWYFGIYWRNPGRGRTRPYGGTKRV